MHKAIWAVVWAIFLALVLTGAVIIQKINAAPQAVGHLHQIES